MRSSLRIVLHIAALGVAFGAGFGLSTWMNREQTTALITGRGKATDGDSVLVGSGNSVVDVRLYGIDAPEYDQECKRGSGESWKCGLIATEELSKLVDGRQLRCEVMSLERTGSRRPVALCFAKKLNISDEMMGKGMAWAFERYLKDDPQYLAHFVTLQANAKAKSLGVWQGEAQEPWKYREDRWERYKAKRPDGCPIIGNTNRKGEKFYHTPWSPNYASMFESKDGKKEWLCSEQEAVLKGYKRAHAKR